MGGRAGAAKHRAAVKCWSLLRHGESKLVVKILGSTRTREGRSSLGTVARVVHLARAVGAEKEIEEDHGIFVADQDTGSRGS